MERALSFARRDCGEGMLGFLSHLLLTRYTSTRTGYRDVFNSVDRGDQNLSTEGFQLFSLTHQSQIAL